MSGVIKSYSKFTEPNDKRTNGAGKMSGKDFNCIYLTVSLKIRI